MSDAEDFPGDLKDTENLLGNSSDNHSQQENETTYYGAFGDKLNLAVVIGEDKLDSSCGNQDFSSSYPPLLREQGQRQWQRQRQRRRTRIKGGRKRWSYINNFGSTPALWFPYSRGFQENLRKETDQDEDETPSTKLKVIRSLAIYFSTFAYGCSNTFLSPAVIALSRQFDTDVPRISLVFTILTATYLTSALLCGFLYNLIKNRSVMLILVLSFQAIPLFIMPHMTNLTAFYILGGFLGAGCGGYDVGQIAGILEIWRGQAAFWVLTQHFAYSLGTILPTVILGPFLPQLNNATRDLNYTNEVQYQDSGQSRDLVLITPFSIAGTLVAVGVLIHILIFLGTRSRAQKPASEPCTNESVESIEENLASPSSATLVPQSTNLVHSKEWASQVTSDTLEFSTRSRFALDLERRTVILTLLSCAIIGPYRGMELTTNQFLPAFSVFSEVHRSEAQGAQVLFAMTTSYASGRGVGIILALIFRRKLKPECLLLVNFLLVMVGNVILLVAGQTDVGYLWAGSICFGAGLSTIVPSYYSYIEPYFFASHSVVSVITVSDGLLASIYPLIVGHSVERMPAVLPFVNFFSMSVVFVSFGLTYYLTRFRNF